MTDKELLELAAKAEGREINWMTQLYEGHPDETFSAGWNPLEDDGDALQLAVKLGFFVDPNGDELHELVREGMDITKLYGHVSYTAARRAIVFAAAEIGSKLK